MFSHFQSTTGLHILKPQRIESSCVIVRFLQSLPIWVSWQVFWKNSSVLSIVVKVYPIFKMVSDTPKLCTMKSNFSNLPSDTHQEDGLRLIFRVNGRSPKTSTWGGIWTHDLWITSPTLFQLKWNYEIMNYEIFIPACCIQVSHHHRSLRKSCTITLVVGKKVTVIKQSHLWKEPIPYWKTATPVEIMPSICVTWQQKLEDSIFLHWIIMACVWVWEAVFATKNMEKPQPARMEKDIQLTPMMYTVLEVRMKW